jgi:hypothetical protein
MCTDIEMDRKQAKPVFAVFQAFDGAPLRVGAQVKGIRPHGLQVRFLWAVRLFIKNELAVWGL